MRVITKDMWKGDTENLVGVSVALQDFNQKILAVDVDNGVFTLDGSSSTFDLEVLFELLDKGTLEIITPEERPDLYPEYFNKATTKQMLPRIDHAQYQCDFTKPMWLCGHNNEMIPVKPEDIVIVRKNQVCLIDTRTDQLRDAMSQDFTNTKPKMNFEDFVEVLTSKCDTHRNVAYFFRNSGLIANDADFEAALEKFQWNK